MAQPSLLIPPQRFSTGKLFAYSPQQGTPVELSVTRGTTAFRTNVSGTLESVASGIARLDYRYAGALQSCPAWLVEPAATNLLLRSEEFDNASWPKVNSTVTANTSTAPDGTSTADSLIPNATLDQHRIDQTPSSTATSQTFSVYVKANGYGFVGLRLGLAGAMFNLSNGVVSLISAGITASNAVNVGNGWYRCSITKATGVANDVCRINVSDGTAIAANFSGDGINSILIWGAQLETGSVATSYIPTVAATATRNADVISLTGASGLIGQTEGVVYIEANIEREVIGAFFAIDDGDTSDFIAITKSSTRQIRAQIRRASGSTITLITSNALSAGNHKIALNYANGDYVLYIDGALAGTSTNSTDYPSTTLSRISLSSTSYGSANDHIRCAAIYKERLTNAELAAITAL